AGAAGAAAARRSCLDVCGARAHCDDRRHARRARPRSDLAKGAGAAQHPPRGRRDSHRGRSDRRARAGSAMNAALLALRLIARFAFILHGWSKAKNPLGWMGPGTPAALQALAVVAELGGGLGGVLGPLTPLASARVA